MARPRRARCLKRRARSFFQAHDDVRNALASNLRALRVFVVQSSVVGRSLTESYSLSRGSLPQSLPHPLWFWIKFSLRLRSAGLLRAVLRCWGDGVALRFGLGKCSDSISLASSQAELTALRILPVDTKALGCSGTKTWPQSGKYAFAMQRIPGADRASENAADNSRLNASPLRHPLRSIRDLLSLLKTGRPCTCPIVLRQDFLQTSQDLDALQHQSKD
jgi:hypothetical protein